MSTSTRSSILYSNHLIPSRNKRQRRRSDPFFLKRPKKRNIFLPTLNKSVSRDDILWEYDNDGKKRKKMVDFNFGTVYDTKPRSSSYDEYRRLSSIQSNMSPGGSNNDLSLNNGHHGRRKKKTGESILKTSNSSSRKTSPSNLHRSPVEPRQYRTIPLPQPQHNDNYSSTNDSSTTITDRDSWVEYSTQPIGLTRPTQTATDFGYWQHKKSGGRNGPFLDTVNHTDTSKRIPLPDLYSYNYSKTPLPRRQQQPTSSYLPKPSRYLYDKDSTDTTESESNTTTITIKKVNPSQSVPPTQPIIDIPSSSDDTNSVNSHFSNSSIFLDGFSKILPVGKFAHQKFHVNRSEEEIKPTDPIIIDLVGSSVDLRSTHTQRDLEFVTENVHMDISNYRSAQISISIEIEKIFCQLETRRWIRRLVNVERNVFIDLYESGYLREVLRVVSENLVENREQNERFGSLSRTKNQDGRNVSLNGNNFKLTGANAARVYNLLMEIAENKFTKQNSTRHSLAKKHFTPKYLIASSNDNVMHF